MRSTKSIMFYGVEMWVNTHGEQDNKGETSISRGCDLQCLSYSDQVYYSGKGFCPPSCTREKRHMSLEIWRSQWEDETRQMDGCIDPQLNIQMDSDLVWKTFTLPIK